MTMTDLSDEEYHRLFLAKTLKKIREELDLEPKELAAKLGFSSNYIYNFEACRQPLNWGTLDFLSRIDQIIPSETRTKERIILVKAQIFSYLARTKIPITYHGGYIQQNSTLADESVRVFRPKLNEMRDNVEKWRCSYIFKDAEWVFSLFCQTYLIAARLSETENDAALRTVLEEIFYYMRHALEDSLFEQPTSD